MVPVCKVLDVNTLARDEVARQVVGLQPEIDTFL
ncbi:hypothetical protein SAMN05518801_1202 [Novosphingobium sp. CF614]|nr:hypothetical protein SAMN05518801_1202 [Novosphingobium sp. CF614]